MRHAPVAVSGVCYGQSDVPTTLDPSAAADSAWPGIEALPITRVVSSPWVRTRELARLLAARKGVPIEIDQRVSELHFGAWEGRRYADLELHDGTRFAAWMAGWETEAPPGGETLDAMRARVHEWIDEHVATESGALVVAHAGVIRLLRARARRDGGGSFGAMLAEPVDWLKVETLEFTGQ